MTAKADSIASDVLKIEFRGIGSEYEQATHNQNGVTYYHDRTWEVVQLTKANFDQYFEYAEMADVQRDSIWNKIDRVCYSYRYVLKAEYQNNVDAKLSFSSDAVPGIAYTYETYQASYTVDEETGKVTITPYEDGSSNAKSDSVSLKQYNDSFFFEIGANCFDDTEGTAYVPKDFEITDVAGTLYFIND